MKREIVASGQEIKDWGEWTYEQYFTGPIAHRVPMLIIYPFTIMEKDDAIADNPATRLQSICHVCGDILPIAANDCITCCAKVPS